MYIYQPKRNSKAHIVLPIFLIVIFFVAIIASNLSISVLPALLQFIAVVAAVFAIQIISRYSVSTFTYEANSEDKTFYVRRLTGKKVKLMAALEYGDIVAVDQRTKDYSVKEKYKKQFVAHNFCNNIFPEKSYCLVCDVEGENIAVYIEADEKLLDLLKNRNTAEE